MFALSGLSIDIAAIGLRLGHFFDCHNWSETACGSGRMIVQLSCSALNWFRVLSFLLSRTIHEIRNCHKKFSCGFVDRLT
jgi:hypothetical protein